MWHCLKYTTTKGASEDHRFTERVYWSDGRRIGRNFYCGCGYNKKPSPFKDSIVVKH
jgi:hypothetical protein